MDVHVNLFQLRTELRIDDIVVLASFTYINALLKHLSKFVKVFQS